MCVPFACSRHGGFQHLPVLGAELLDALNCTKKRQFAMSGNITFNLLEGIAKKKNIKK